MNAKYALVLAVKKMCVAAGANGAIVVFQLEPKDYPEQAPAIEAVLVSFDEAALTR